MEKGVMTFVAHCTHIGLEEKLLILKTSASDFKDGVSVKVRGRQNDLLRKLLK